MKPGPFSLLLLLGSLAACVLSGAEPTGRRATAGPSVAPLPEGIKAKSDHAAYDPTDCSGCHKNADPANPGPLLGTVNETCLECHEDYRKKLAKKHLHKAVGDGCTGCHNPHNAAFPKLLLDDPGRLCIRCHEKVGQLAATAKVRHGALTTGAGCMNCHNPHASDNERLLTDVPMKKCLSCHGRDDLVDAAGTPLANLVKHLAVNPTRHQPVSSGECVACHNPHGSDEFRLLRLSYPATFYAGFTENTYALCLDCHENALLTEAEGTQTRFRDGKRNLHFLHVNKEDRGRSCRVCHDVHASRQGALLRDSVPYGPKGWLLRLNYTRTPTGGTCARTCHESKSYNINSTKSSETSP